MAARRRPPTHSYIFVLTMIVVVVAAFLVAVPGRVRYTDEEIWATFRGEEPTEGSGTAVERRASDGTWRISATRHSRLGEHVHYEQIVGGRPVLGAWSQEHRLAGGRSLVAGRRTRLEAPRSLPRHAVDAVRIAQDVVGVTARRAEIRTSPAYLPTERGLVPVTVVTIPALEPLGDFVVVVDESSGAVMSVDDVLSEADGTGDVFEREPGVPCGSGPETPDSVLMSFISSVTLKHLTGTGYLDGRYVRTLNGGDTRAVSPAGIFRYAPSHTGFEQVMCYYMITTYFAHVESLGVKGYSGDALVADAHGYPGDNSFYSPSTGQLTFGDGGVPDAQDPEIILHELGHALHHRAQPTYAQSYASRALSEGIADYIACSFFDDPLVAEWDAAAYSSTCPPYLRRIDRFLVYPDDVTGSVHADGQIWSSALWQVRAALGADVTDRLLLESLFLLPAAAGPPEAARAFLQADTILEEGAHVARADEIFRARGILRADVSIDLATPQIFARAYPNPFRDSGMIRYVLPRAGRVRVDIMDVQGRLVRTLVDADETGGSHSITWDGTDRRGRRVPEGIYFFHVMSGALITTGKLVRLP